MLLLWYLACVVAGSFLAEAQEFRSPHRDAIRRENPAKPSKKVETRITRKNTGDDILLRPLVGKVLPYFEDIAFDEPCLDRTKVRIAVDTGSSDLWIDSSVWCDCKAAIANPTLYPQCSQIGAMKTKKPALALKYDDNFEAHGTMMKANLWFDRKKIKNIWLLAAWEFKNPPSDANALSGSIGLGYMEDQQLRNKYGDIRYQTLPMVLEQNGNTTSDAYSMWFRNTEAKQDFSASILFGGYVSNYFKGTLSTFQVLPEPGIVIQLDQITFQSKIAFTSCKESLPVMLDTGSFGSYLPHDTFKALADKIGKYEFVENAIRKVALFDDCTNFNWDEPLRFKFGNSEISVPLRDIIRFATKAEEADQTAPFRPIKNAKKQCLTHGIATWPAETSRQMAWAFSGPVAPSARPTRRAILGITFLRHAYVLYDLPQSEVAIAPIDDWAVRNILAEQYSFIDGYVHQGQAGYDPQENVAHRCAKPLSKAKEAKLVRRVLYAWL